MAGVFFRDLFAPGAVAGIAAGQPFIDRAVGNATQTNLEAFYSFPISDNIRITPLVQAIVHPADQNANGTIDRYFTNSPLLLRERFSSCNIEMLP